ncbi:MAG: ABC transporter substrate-binding protein [Desulfosporosinus sp.]|nr:ABC transporter substrate-binding protein [Desulfosporosinus sp.]
MSIFRRNFRVIASIALIFVLFSLTGCGSVSKTPDSGAGGKSSAIKLRIGYPVGSLTKELFLQTGIDKGIFAKYGLEVEGEDYSVGGQIIQDLAGGNLDVGIVGPSPALIGAAQGVDLKIVASGIKNYCPLVARKGINSIKELNGKKVGTPGVSSIEETMLNYLESQQGIKTKHVYANVANLTEMLDKGELDAIVPWEPVAADTVAKVAGAHYLLDTILPNAEAADITVPGKFFRDNPNTIVSFLKAAEEIRQYILKHTDERVKAAAQITGLPESVIAESIRRSHEFTTPLQINMDSIKLIASSDIASGKLRGIDQNGLNSFLAKNIDSALLQQALQ